MRSVRAIVAGCCLISFLLSSVVPAAAQPVADQAPPPPAQLMVRVALPPGTFNASLFLNETFVAWLQGGVLAAPVVLAPGGYSVRASAPGLRSYETNVELLPGQLLEISGALVADQQPASIVPLVPGTPSPPATTMTPIKQPRSAAKTYQSIIWGIGLTALGLALVGGIAIGIACGAGKCKSSSHHD